MARRMAQAPNTYPTWFAPKAPVAVAFSPKFLTNFPKQFVAVGPPAAQLCYRVVEPADYHLKISSTNWLEHGRKQFEFTFHADLPGAVECLDVGAARHGGVAARLRAGPVFDGALGIAAGAGRLAVCAGGPARTRQIHGQADLFRRPGGARPEPAAGRAGAGRPVDRTGGRVRGILRCGAGVALEDGRAARARRWWPSRPTRDCPMPC